LHVLFFKSVVSFVVHHTVVADMVFVETIESDRHEDTDHCEECHEQNEDGSHELDELVLRILVAEILGKVEGLQFGYFVDLELDVLLQGRVFTF